eukprot:1009577-Prorocentrum_minimum.AAC.1
MQKRVFQTRARGFVALSPPLDRRVAFALAGLASHPPAPPASESSADNWGGSRTLQWWSGLTRRLNVRAETKKYSYLFILSLIYPWFIYLYIYLAGVVDGLGGGLREEEAGADNAVGAVRNRRGGGEEPLEALAGGLLAGVGEAAREGCRGGRGVRPHG